MKKKSSKKSYMCIRFRWLTFPLYLKHADCVLGAQRTELTGRERVATLAPRGNLKGSHERQGTHYRHSVDSKSQLSIIFFDFIPKLPLGL